MPGPAYHLVFPGHDTGRHDLSGGQQIPQVEEVKLRVLGYQGSWNLQGILPERKEL